MEVVNKYTKCLSFVYCKSVHQKILKQGKIDDFWDKAHFHIFLNYKASNKQIDELEFRSLLSPLFLQLWALKGRGVVIPETKVKRCIFRLIFILTLLTSIDLVYICTLDQIECLFTIITTDTHLYTGLKILHLCEVFLLYVIHVPIFTKYIYLLFV